MNVYKKYLSVLLPLAASFFVFKTVAQESIGFAVSPPTFELSANPGDTLSNVVRVENLSDSELTIEMDTRNFTAYGEEGAVGLTDEEGGFSLASWIEVPPTQEVIQPRSNKLIGFKVNIPNNAEPGGHFGSIVFRVVNSKTVDGSGAALSQEIGALVLLRIAGDTTETAEILDFKPENTFNEYGPVSFDVRIKNEGNVHVKPQGGVVIVDFFGRKVANVDISPKNVLPGAVRKIPLSWDRKLLFGKFTATTSLVYGSENKILTASTTFFVIPYKLAGGVLLGVSIVFLFFYRARKRLKMAFKVLFGK